MAIKPGMGRKASNKNPPFLSHEFVIQNHADIVSCVVMVFVVGLMLQTSSAIAGIFITLHHNVTDMEPTPEHPMGGPLLYEAGWKDCCAIFFYTLICIIMHAILQEYVLDKVSKKLHLSKFKLSRFNESGQLVVFYCMSIIWGFDIINREGYFSKFSLLWDNYPNHQMIFLHKLYFIIQLAYYFHMVPELYFQKVKKEEHQSKIIHSVSGYLLILVPYFLNYQRLTLVLLTLHYCSELTTHNCHIIEIFDKDEKFAKSRILKNLVFAVVRFFTMVISVLTLFYGNSEYKLRGLLVLLAIFGLQGYLIFRFIHDYLKMKRIRQAEQKAAKKQKALPKVDGKLKKEKKKESDLPEADQNTGKLKTK